LVKSFKNQFNQHDKLNDVLQKIALKTGNLTTNAHYTLDYDNVIIENEKADAANKMATGYQPGVASTYIGRQIVFIEGRAAIRLPLTKWMKH
jgi:hypothetical protein